MLREEDRGGTIKQIRKMFNNITNSLKSSDDYHKSVYVMQCKKVIMDDIEFLIEEGEKSEFIRELLTDIKEGLQPDERIALKQFFIDVYTHLGKCVINQSKE